MLDVGGYVIKKVETDKDFDLFYYTIQFNTTSSKHNVEQIAISLSQWYVSSADNAPYSQKYNLEIFHYRLMPNIFHIVAYLIRKYQLYIRFVRILSLS